MLTLSSSALLVSTSLLLMVASSVIGRSDAPWRVSRLRCDALENPTATASPTPLLRWQVESEAPNEHQSAAEVLVASTRDLLSEKSADLWSVRIEGTATSLRYNGQAIAPGQTVYWTVRSFNSTGTPSAWAPAASFAVGLAAADWKSQWIGFDQPRDAAERATPLYAAKWIWHAADPAQPGAVQRVFCKTFKVPENHGKIGLIATADDKLSVAINGKVIHKTPAGKETWRHAAELDLTPHLHPGDNDVRLLAKNEGASAGVLAVLSESTENGDKPLCMTDATWTSAPAGDDWATADVANAAPAKVVANYGDQPWGRLQTTTLLPAPALMRKEFAIDQPIARAMLYVTVQGIADFSLNGKSISSDYFSTGWSDYTKRSRYRAYDVTTLLAQGTNAIGIELADGWFAGHIGWGGQRDHYGKLPRVRAQLQVTKKDGSTQVVSTDDSWKATTGPRLYSDFLQGEFYDARSELPGWNSAGFSDEKWSPVIVGSTVNGPAEPHPGPAVHNFAPVAVQEITQPKPGMYVLNLGQNFAGVYRFNVRGQRDQRITLRFAERLNADGTVYTENLRSAKATDTYIYKGDGVETISPRFTFHGFQYVEVIGLTQPPEKSDFVGLPLSSDTPIVGTFNCSDPMINKLWSNSYWTQRANFIDVPTDCPQRDERLGWTGDAQVYIRAAALHTDIEAFFTKWLVDLEDAQRKDGQFPMVAPVKVAGDDGGPAWAEAGVICPWVIYEKYNNLEAMTKHYGSMKKYVDFLVARSTPELLPPAKYHCFGDWLNIKADTPHDVIYMAYFAHSADIVAKSAKILGKNDDSADYADIAARVRKAFNGKYVKPDGRIEGNTQCCYVLAIAYDLLDAEKTKLAGQYLIEDIEKRDGCMSTGFVGTKDIMFALSKIGRNDVAFSLLHNTKFPSWGFSIVNGATTIWERWNSWTPDKGFGDAGMNSFSHYAYGAVTQWMVETIGGIKNGSPGYQTILLEPVLDPNLSFADVTYDRVAGRIESHWKREGKSVKFTFIVPANTTATITLPGKPSEKVGSGKYDREIEAP